MSTTTTTQPRIYVACLASYVAGKLYGDWMDVDDVDALREQIGWLLKSSPEPHAEEHAIHDHEGFGGYPIGEYEDIGKVCELAGLIEEHGEVAGALAAHLGTVKDAAYALEEGAYEGEHASDEDWAYAQYESMGAELGELATYIAWDQVARDMRCGGCFSVDVDGSTHYVRGV